MTPDISPEPDIKTLKEIKNFLRFHEMTIRRWIKEGKIPARRAGGRWKFSLKEIETWMLTRGNM